METNITTAYKPKDFAKLLCVSVNTLQRWDREGLLKAHRTPSNRRFYTHEQYLKCMRKGMEDEEGDVVTK